MLTYGLLQEFLRQRYAISALPAELSEISIEEVALFAGNNRGKSVLYLTTDEKDCADNVLLITGQPSDHWHIQTEPGQILTTISSILSDSQKLMTWQYRCHILAEAEHDLQSLLDEACRFFSTRWMLVDRSYRIAAAAPSFQTWQANTSAQTRAFPLQAMEELYSSDPDFDQTFTSSGICPYPQFEIDGYHLHYYNIHQESLYLGRVLLAIPDDVSADAIQPGLRFLCQLAESCYQYIYLHQQDSFQRNEGFVPFRKLLLQEPVEQETVEHACLQRGWHRNDRFEIIRLVPNGYFHSEQTLKYYAVQLECQFPHCVAVQLSGGITCIHHLPSEKRTQFRSAFSGFLRENLFKAGFSNPFHDVFQAYSYSCQAADALALGQKKDPSLWRYEFVDYVIDCTIQQCLSRYAPLDLCPRNLRAILEYDTAHPDSELAETLYQYYACSFNAQEAAKKLFIHRTTFFYRMNKIQKIAAFHLDDPKEIFQILLALTAIRQARETDDCASQSGDGE